MFVPALLLLLLNSTYWTPQPRLQAPLGQTLGQALLPVAPLPCSLPPSEGLFVGEGSILCRSPPPETPVNQSWDIIRATYQAATDSWTTRVIGPGAGPLISWISDPANNTWILSSPPGGPASGGGTAGGNGGPPVLTYYPADAAAGGPITLYSGPLMILSLQQSDQGIYALVRNTTTAPGIGLLQTGVATWSTAGFPRTPFQDVPWMQGTLVPRYLMTFVPPTRAQPQTFYAASGITLEVWAKNTIRNTWVVESSITLRATGSQSIVQLLSQPPTVRVLTRKTVSQITVGPSAGGPTESLLASLPPTSPLSYQSFAPSFVWGSPTASARPTGTATGSPSSTMSAHVTVSAVPTLPPGESPWTTPTAAPSTSAAATATASSSATGSSTASSSASASPSTSSIFTRPPTESYAPAPSSGLRSYTETATASATPGPSLSLTSSPTPNNTTDPPAAAATGLTPQQELGLGFGLTTALLVIGGGIATLFFRQAVFSVVHWFKQKIQGVRRAPRHPQPRRANSVAGRGDPSVIQLSLNPALMQQQTTLDILHLARQQRLEAMQTQMAQRAVPDQHLPPKALRSFKISYAPQRAPGFPGSSV